MTVPLRAALYLRVSTARQAEHDVSIPDQKRQGESYCAARGYQLVETYVEAGASATNDRRPEFQRMIEAGTSKPAPFDIVIVHSFSRFFRDHFELEFYVRRLAKNGVRLVSITQEMGDEQIAEPCLEHVELGIGDWHRVGPIVGDGPRFNIVLGRAPHAWPALRLDVKIVRQNSQAGAWSGHPGSIASRRTRTNGLSLSRSTLFLLGKSVMKGALTLISNLDRLASPRRAGDSRSRPQPGSGGTERASLDGLAAVRPACAKAVMVQLALRDSVSGRSNFTRSCITFGVMRPRSPRSRRTRP
jgi:hypothetical protein